MKGTMIGKTSRSGKSMAESGPVGQKTGIPKPGRVARAGVCEAAIPGPGDLVIHLHRRRGRVERKIQNADINDCSKNRGRTYQGAKANHGYARDQAGTKEFPGAHTIHTAV